MPKGLHRVFSPAVNVRELPEKFAFATYFWCTATPPKQSFSSFNNLLHLCKSIVFYLPDSFILVIIEFIIVSII